MGDGWVEFFLLPLSPKYRKVTIIPIIIIKLAQLFKILSAKIILTLIQALMKTKFQYKTVQWNKFLIN